MKKSQISEQYRYERLIKKIFPFVVAISALIWGIFIGMELVKSGLVR